MCIYMVYALGVTDSNLGGMSLANTQKVDVDILIYLIYRVSHNLWQFPGNCLQIANYDRYSKFEAIFEMPCLGKYKKTTFYHEKGVQSALFQSNLKNSRRGFLEFHI